MEITIDETRRHGKFLGIATYAGFPLLSILRIKFGDVFTCLNSCMEIEDPDSSGKSNFRLIFWWGESEHNYSFYKSQLETELNNCQFSVDKEFLGVGYEIDVFPDDGRVSLCVGDGFYILVTEQNKEIIEHFLKDFVQKLKNLLEEAQKCFDRYERFIKEDGLLEKFLANRK